MSSFPVSCEQYAGVFPPIAPSPASASTKPYPPIAGSAATRRTGVDVRLPAWVRPAVFRIRVRGMSANPQGSPFDDFSIRCGRDRPPTG